MSKQVMNVGSSVQQVQLFTLHDVGHGAPSKLKAHLKIQSYLRSWWSLPFREPIDGAWV